MKKTLANLIKGVVVGVAVNLAISTTCFADYKTDLNMGKGFFSAGRAAEKKGDNETAGEKYKSALEYFRQAQEQKSSNEKLNTFIERLENKINAEYPIEEPITRQRSEPIERGEARTTRISIKTGYSPSASSNRTVIDKSSSMPDDPSTIMPINYKDELKTSKTSLEATIQQDLINKFSVEVGFETTSQNGTLTRDFKIEEFLMEGTETGDYSRVLTRLNFLLGAKIKEFELKAGLGHLTEKISNSYTQTIPSSFPGIIFVTDYTKEQSMTGLGPVAKVNYRRKGAVNVDLNLDLLYLLSVNETYNSKATRESVPDNEFERQRDVGAYLLGLSGEIIKPIDKGILGGIGVRAYFNQFPKDVTMTSTTEKNNITEKYIESRTTIGGGVLFNIKRAWQLMFGFEQEKHTSKGSLVVKKDVVNRAYVAGQLNLF